MPEKKCRICSKKFYVKPSHILLGHGKYCSMICQWQSQRRGKYVLCEVCNKEIWRTPKALKHSKSNRYFCNKSCQTLWRNKVYVGAKHHNWKGGEHAYQRLMKINNIFPICNLCSMDNKKVLVIHHKDHDRKNNKIENLMWLCRNCHYIIHNGKTV